MNSNSNLPKLDHEIIHGKTLSQGDTELIWGWGTTAGKIRADRRAEIIIAGAHMGPEKKVLEIGCGTGNFTERFARTGAKITAVDISPDLLDIARKRGLPEEQVQFLERRFEDCRFDEPFDAIIGSSVLHHLDIEEALLRTFALLKPGGYASFAEPNMLNPQIFIERKFSFLRRLFWYVSPDETAFIRWQLKRLLRKTGFVNIKIVPFDWLHPKTPGWLIKTVRNVGEILEKIPGVCEFSGSIYIQCRKPLDAR